MKSEHFLDNFTATFYDEDQIIKDEFRHLKTPQRILEELSDLKAREFDAFFDSRATLFVMDSLAFNQEVRDPYPQGSPLMTYDTFTEMTNAQHNWYFYWRGCALQGEYLETHASYVYLFAYELINYSFNPHAAFNVSMLIRLEEAYGEKCELRSLIADLFVELGEGKQSRLWRVSKEVKASLLYEALKSDKPISKISINTWKTYVSIKRKTPFFKAHRNKIYKTFKECLPVLEELHEGTLLEAYFTVKIKKEFHQIFPSAIIHRPEGDDRYHFIEREVPHPKAQAFEEITAYYRLAENITRMLQGEKRQLKIDANVLPKDFHERMLHYLQQVEERKRFKQVKEKSTTKGSKIPQPKPVTIEFNDEKIKQLQEETNKLVEEVERRANVYEEELEILVTQQEEKPLTVSLDAFFNAGQAQMGDEELATFIETLTELERDFLRQFENHKINKKVATQFVKAKGKMLGSLLESINEKSQDVLEENLLESEGECLVIYEEFEAVMVHLQKNSAQSMKEGLI